MFKKLACCLAVLLALGGCNRSEKGGGAAAGGHTFRLSAPSSSTEVKQGETRTVQVTISRDKEFVDDVSLTAEAPEGSGLSTKLGASSVKTTDTYVDLNVTAGQNAMVGSHKVRVVGTPARGNAVEVLVPIKVAESPAKQQSR